MATCAYCERVIPGPAAVKGRDDKLYCSAVCCDAADKDFYAEMRLTEWYACEMHGGGKFVAPLPNADTSQPIYGENHRIAGGSYRILYGPCNYVEAMEYMNDVGG